MQQWLPLLGVPVMVLGFALRLNALLVVLIAGALTGWANGLDFDALLQLFGQKFLAARQLAAFVLVLPVIGLLEHLRPEDADPRAGGAPPRRHRRAHPDAVFPAA